jgi:SDR family mycofactocin-dependent oxidoreductase
MKRLDGKVAFITGAARGQGREHALTLAREGADIIAFDICESVESAPPPAPSAVDLDDTMAQVEALGRQAVSARVDVRDEAELTETLNAAVHKLGRLDIVIANAGINAAASSCEQLDVAVFREVLDINLTGSFLTAKAAIPHLRAHGGGGSIVLINSVLGLKGVAGSVAYAASKHGGVALMTTLAVELAPHRIRVNSIHATNVATPMIHNDTMYRRFNPDLADPGLEDLVKPMMELNLLPVPWVEPADISEAVLYLVCESGRYVTGTTMVVDAGWLRK